MSKNVQSRSFEKSEKNDHGFQDPEKSETLKYAMHFYEPHSSTIF